MTRTSDMSDPQAVARLPLRLPTIKQRAVNIVVWVAVFSQIALMSVLAFLYYEPPWLYYANLPVPVLKKVLHPGEPVPLYVVRCSSLSEVRTYISSRTLERVDQYGNVLDVILLTGTPVSAEPGCHPITSHVNVLPGDLKRGRYRAAGKAQIEGAIRTRWISWYSQEFEVDDAAPPGAVGGGQ